MPHQVLWFLLAANTLLAISHLAMAASGSSPVPAPSMPGSPCPSPGKCGDIVVPYPFGIGPDCARRGHDNFQVVCNDSFDPPRLYTGNLEIISISLETGEVRVVTPVSYICYTSNDTFESRVFAWNVYAPYLISTMKNVFTAIGCNTVAYLQGREDWSYYTGCITSCSSLEEAAGDGDECAGLGCCQSLISRNLSTIAVTWNNNNGTRSINPAWSYNPCSYAILAEKGRYKFSRGDLARANDSFASWVEQEKIPMVLDWAIRDDGSCRPPAKDAGPSAKSTAPGCISEHSFCVNPTHGPGYLCNCSEGYKGNPYITGGCTNIDQCQLPQLHSCPSGSKCIDIEGNYRCQCKFGRKGKDCRPIFPAPAAAILATLVASLLLLLLIWYVHVDRKRRMKTAFFDKNGGKILKGAAGINIFTEVQLDKFTNHYKTPIGKGSFGMVFIGITDEKQRVAVKRSIMEGDKLGGDNFQLGEDIVNEITFQFRNSHPNLVRLVGCCLETKIPVLVFEYIPNGSLYNLLHVATQKVLPLLTRLKIAISSAKALAYIHSHGDHERIHGDVKSANILLDDNLMPKVSDFGSSKLLSIDMYAMAVAADMSYVDPVYMKTERFVKKSDVYSFGMVLLELITRKTVKYGKNRINSLPMDFIKSCKDKGNGREMYDTNILSHRHAQCHRCIECLDKIGALAVRCLKEDVDERPTMAEVVDELKKAAEVVDQCKHQGNIIA